jgi:hypothetical protein
MRPLLLYSAVLGYGTLLLAGLVPAAVFTLASRRAEPLSLTAAMALAVAQILVGVVHAGVGWKMRGVLDLPGWGEGGLRTLVIYLGGWALCAFGATLALAGALQLAESSWSQPLQSLLTALLLGVGLLVGLALLGLGAAPRLRRLTRAEGA